MAPQHRFRQQQHIAARQKDGLLRGADERRLAGEAPVVAIDIGDGLIENDKRLQGGASQRGEETLEVLQFDSFPAQAAANVDGTTA